MPFIWQSRPGCYTAQVNSGGKRTTKTFTSKTEARRWARHHQVAIDEGPRPVKTVTITDFAEDDPSAMIETKPSSRSKRAAIRIITEHVGRMPVCDITVSAIRDFARDRRNGGTRPATIVMDLSYLGSILRHGGALMGVDTAQALAHLSSTRTVPGSAGAVSCPEERTRRPTDAVLIALRNFWSNRRRRIPMWAITLFAICTAMRLSEITRIA
jgi:hypothetical protein